MKYNLKRFTGYAAAPLLLGVLSAACSDDVVMRDGVADGELLDIRAVISQQAPTRADESGFADGDRMGVFVVGYSSGAPGTLTVGSNHASNVAFTLDADAGQWNAPTPLYWPDSKSGADIYGYYPFDNQLSSVDAYHFEVKADQSVAASDGDMCAYEASDFLWAKTPNAQPGSRVNLTFHHKMAGVRVVLQEGEGFSDGEFARLPKTVTVDNTLRSATVNLSTGVVTATGSYDRDIVMNPESECWRAVVVPQAVASGKSTIGITIDGVAIPFTRDGGMTYEAGKLHTFTINVKKTDPSGKFEISLASLSISDWLADESGHDFDANSYLVVNNAEAGKLSEAIAAAGADPATVKNLKVTGVMNTDDFTFIREGMEKLASVNLKDVKIPEVCVWSSGLPDGEEIYCENALPAGAFDHNKTIRRYILPETIVAIGMNAFTNTEPSSTIIIPETVTKIYEHAFSFIWENAEIVLPGKLEYVGDYAFYTAAKFEMRLPSTLKYIGDHAFQNAGNAYGAFSIPPNLEHLGEQAFINTGTNLTGEIVIPAGLLETVEMGLGFAKGTDITIPEGVRIIKRLGGKFNSPVILPKSLEQIGSQAFYGTRFSSPIVFPENIAYIGPGAFLVSNLPGRVEIPPLIDCVKESSFNCTAITEVIVGDNVLQIEDYAFGRNGSLRYVEFGKNLEFIGKAVIDGSPILETIVCFAKEPPSASESFVNLDFTRTVLEVPEGCVSKYRNADGWRQFKNITEHRELAFDIPLIECLEKGVTRTGKLRAEGAWSVVEKPDWVTVNPSSGESKDELTVTVASQNHDAEAREGEIVFKLNDKDYRYTVDVKQRKADNAQDQAITLLDKTATEGEEIPVMIVGEGFTASQIVSGEYFKRMNETKDQFFAIEPYKSLQGHFKVVTAIACSPEEGVSDYTQTKVNCFDTFDLEPKVDKLREYVQTVWPEMSSRMDDVTVIVVTNHNVFSGWTTICDDGFTVASIGNIPENEAYPYDRRGLVQHYAGGAAFAGLGAEYVSHFEHIKSCKCGACNALGTFNEMKAHGYFANLSLSGKMSDAPWKDFIFDPKYSADVDMWEGGYRHLRGVWRSESQSVMGTYINYYNTVSRYEIYKRAMDRAGLGHSLESFIANDKIEKPQ